MRIPRLGLALPLALLLAGLSPLRAEDPELATEQDKKLYTLGLALSRTLVHFEFSEAELALLQAGLRDGVLHRDERVSLEGYGPKVEEMLLQRFAAITAREEEQGELLRAKAAAEEGAVVTESGMVYRPIEVGSGERPTEASTVKIHYEGMRRDGGIFETTRSGTAAGPMTTRLEGVIRCVAEGVKRMKVGGVSRMICPPDLAYGAQGLPPHVPPGATLIFEVELLEILPTAAPPLLEP